MLCLGAAVWYISLRPVFFYMNQQKIAFGIVALGALTAIVIIFTSSSSTAQLRQELLSIKNTIPTEAGKNDFLKQSNNLSQKVDPELVDLDSQVISCDPSLDSLISSNPSYGGSCV